MDLWLGIAIRFGVCLSQAVMYARLWIASGIALAMTKKGE